MTRIAMPLMLLWAGSVLSACSRTVPGATCERASDCGLGASCVDGVCILPADAGPALSLSSPKEGEVVREKLVIAGRATEVLLGVAAVEYSVAEASWAPLALSGDAFEIALAPSPEPVDYHPFTLRVRATDRAGRSTTVEVHCAVDQVAPSIQFPAPLDSEDTEPAKVNASSPGMTCLLDSCTLTLAPVLTDLGTAHLSSAKLDGSDVPVSGDAVSLSFAASESGQTVHVLEVAAEDEAGNRAMRSRRFRVDADPPKVEFLEPAVDFDCSRDACTGAVVNLANASNRSIVLSGRASDPAATLTLKIGSQPEMVLSRGGSGEWSHTWEIGSANDEVDVVARAVDSFGNATAATRKIWVDLVAPSCSYVSSDRDRQVASAGPLLACTEAMSLNSLRQAFLLDGRATGPDSYIDSTHAFHASKSALAGNTTYLLELKDGATDKAGNPAPRLAAIRFRTAPVLPAAETTLRRDLAYPRVAIDADGLPVVFAWDTEQKRPVLFAWNGEGDGSAALGAWVSSTPLGGALGPVRDFRLTQFDPGSLPLNPDLSLKRAGRVLMSPDPSASSAVTAAYAQSEDGLATFHGAKGAGFDPDLLPDLSPSAQPSFFGEQEALEDPGKGWTIRGPLVEKVLLTSFSEPKVQVRTVSPEWPPDSTVLDPIAGAATVVSMHQGGFVGIAAGASEPHAFLAALGDSGAPIPVLQGSTPAVAVAGLHPLYHSAQDVGYATGFLAWSERSASGSSPVALRVGCYDKQSQPRHWVVSDPLGGFPAGATEIAGIDFGQGVSRVAIAVDVAVSSGRVSWFGLLSGDRCDASLAVDWTAAGGAVEGWSPTTAFSSSGVLWRARVSAAGLRVLAPLKP